MGPTFTWEKSTQRYRYTSGDRSGQFVGVDTLQDLIGDYQSQQKDIGQSITDRLINGDINTAQWVREQAAQLKQGHINMHGLGLGGHANFDAAEYGSVGATMRRELGFLRNFAQEIQDGNLSEAQIRARTNLYYNTLWRTHAHARERAHEDEGFQWERRLTAPSEVCPDCVGYAAQGWVEIGSLPDPGEASVCHSNCRCRKEFAQGDNRPTNSLLDHSFGWIGTMTTETSSTPTLDLDAAVAIAQKFNPNVSRQDVEDVVAQMGDEVEVEPAPTVSTMQAETELEGFYWGEPNAEDLALIEEHTGFQWNSEDWFMVPMRASDNLLWSSEELAWHSSVLVGMTQQLPGQTLMVDHNAWEIENSRGFYVRSAMARSMTVPVDVLESQGQGEANRDRVSQDGWLQVYLIAAIPASEQKLIHALKTRQIEDVSTGSILGDRDYICPHCTQAHGREVSFYERDNKGGDFLCPHSIPSYFARLMASLWGEEVNFADYAIVTANGKDRHYETSFVGVGNLASAEVLRPVS